jgi:hypothetical protein
MVCPSRQIQATTVKIFGMSRTMRRRALITSPLAWQMTAAPVSPPLIPVLAERGGTQLKALRGVVLVDTREQNPFDFSRFAGWFTRMEKKRSDSAITPIAGLEDICVVERKDLADLVHSFTVHRSAFVNRLRRMTSYGSRTSCGVEADTVCRKAIRSGT